MNDYSTYAAAYAFGRTVGVFFVGCLFGLFPLIAAAVKKRTGTGVTWMLTCGALAWGSPLVSLIAAVISGIVLCCMKPPKPQEPVVPENPKIHVPEKGGWICPTCGLVHDKEIEICFHCRTPKSQATKFI